MKNRFNEDPKDEPVSDEKLEQVSGGKDTPKSSFGKKGNDADEDELDEGVGTKGF